MKKAIVAGGIVIGALLVLVLFLPGLLLDAGTGSDMELIFYDADGNEIGQAATAGFFGLGIQELDGTADIASVLVRVGFTVTTNIEYLAIYTYCYLEVVTAINDVQHDDVVYTVAEHQMGSPNSDLSGTFEATYLMSDLLPDSAIEQYGKLHGWIMSFNARVQANLDLEDSIQRDVQDTCGIDLTLVWVDTEVAEELRLESWIALP